MLFGARHQDVIGDPGDQQISELEDWVSSGTLIGVDSVDLPLDRVQGVRV